MKKSFHLKIYFINIYARNIKNRRDSYLLSYLNPCLNSYLYTYLYNYLYTYYY